MNQAVIRYVLWERVDEEGNVYPFGDENYYSDNGSGIYDIIGGYYQATVTTFEECVGDTIAFVDTRV